MPHRFKFLFVLILISLFYRNSIKTIKGAGEFLTDYDVSYQLETTGIARITQKITLTNQLSQIYATKYTLTLQSGELSNIQASDNLGPLKTTVSRTGDKTIINLTFNQQTIGNGKALNFTVSYALEGLITKNGRVTEVKIPKIVDTGDIKSYLLKIITPSQLGQLAYISPETSNIQKIDLQTIFIFNKEQLLNNGVSLAFGDFQVFDFILNYHLDNPNNQSVQAEIALPPDTAFQEVNFQQLQPMPKEIHSDDDGNWLASYQLKPKEKLEITAKGDVQIFNKQQTNFPVTSEQNLNNNLVAQKYWQVNDPQIIVQAQKLKTAKNIYNFVVKSLKYDFNRLNADSQRLGAVQALQNPNSAICTEFTDLFITLSRAAGIPAREINGYAYTSNEKLKPISLTTDVLHAWPEYWDFSKKIWLPVDPTWGNTTQGINYFDKSDLNHFVFVIHGVSSTEPLPAGAYKTSTSTTKDIQVTFGNFKNTTELPLKITLNLASKLAASQTIQGTIVLQNPNGKAIYRPNLNIDSPLKVNIGENPTVILPFSTISIPISVSSEGTLDYGQKPLIITLNNKTTNLTITVFSKIPVNIIIVVGVTGLILVTGIIAFFMIKKRKRNKH